MTTNNYAIALVKAAMLRASAICESRSRAHSDHMASLEAGKCGWVIESLIERESGEIIAAVPRPEPVGWVTDNPDDNGRRNDFGNLDKDLPNGTPLYTEQPAPAELVNARLVEVTKRMLSWMEGYDHATGYCCCGDAIINHPSAMTCGHTPVDAGYYAAGDLMREAKSILAADRELRGNHE